MHWGQWRAACRYVQSGKIGWTKAAVELVEGLVFVNLSYCQIIDPEIKVPII